MKKILLSMFILLYSNAYAATLTSSVSAIIAAAPTIVQVSPINFGIITGNSSSTNPLTYIIDTANNVTTSGSGVGTPVGGVAFSGSFTLTSVVGQNLSIYVNNYINGTAPGGNIVTVGAATCKYGAVAASSCDGTGNALVIPMANVTAVANLKVGISMVVPASTSTAGAISGLGYTINVLYS